jgi:hypothetical protein
MDLDVVGIDYRARPAAIQTHAVHVRLLRDPRQRFTSIPAASLCVAEAIADPLPGAAAMAGSGPVEGYSKIE